MEKGGQCLSPEEIGRLLGGVENHRDKLLLSLLYESGCTVNEAVNLQVQDIKGDHIHFSQETARNKSARTAFISHHLHLELVHFCLSKKPEEFVFSSRQSGKMTTKRCRQIVQSLTLKVLGEGLNPTDIRYSHIAHALEKNVPLNAIQQQVGLDALRMSQLVEQFGKKSLRGYGSFFDS